MNFPTRRCRTAFTLVELLVVIGIIAVLIAILLPSLAKARDQGNIVKCASNMRQVAQALTNYAAENHGRYPPNLDAGSIDGTNPTTAQLWYNYDQIGHYLPKTIIMGSNSIATPIFVCPVSPPNTMRSYAMNIWASSGVNKAVVTTMSTVKPNQPRGKLIGSASKESALTILLTEALVKIDGGSVGIFTQATTGYYGDLPGERFLGITKPSVYDAGGTLAGKGYSVEIDLTRHRASKDRTAGAAARGRMNIAFMDGHVSLLAHDELADPVTKKSRFVAIWSPQDRIMEAP